MKLSVLTGSRWPSRFAQRSVSYLVRHEIRGSYGSSVPRQAFLPMIEAGIGLGLTNLLLSTTASLFEWERTGTVPKNQGPWPLFVDCSHGLDPKLRGVSEASMTECLARFERLPVLMMLARVLDDRARFDRKLRDASSSSGPDASPWLNVLGEIFHERNERADTILNGLDEDCLRLAEALEQESPEVALALKVATISPALRLAEALVDLIGHKQQGSNFLKALDSSLTRQMASSWHLLWAKAPLIRWVTRLHAIWCFTLRHDWFACTRYARAMQCRQPAQSVMLFE